MSSICVPTPITAGDLLIIDSGYEFGRPRPLLAVRPGASGDISLKEGETSNRFIAWYREPAGSYHPTPLYYGGLLYVLYSTGLVGCFDPQTGDEVYGKQRLGGSVTASPWAANGKIFCLNEDGDTFVLAAGREFKLLGKNSLDEMTMATPAATDRGLFIRTLTQLYCLRSPSVQAATSRDSPLAKIVNTQTPRSHPMTKLKCVAILTWLTAAIAFSTGLLSAGETALDRYVAKPDPTYSWKVVRTVPGNPG